MSSKSLVLTTLICGFVAKGLEDGERDAFIGGLLPSLRTARDLLDKDRTGLSEHEIKKARSLLDGWLAGGEAAEAEAAAGGARKGGGKKGEAP